MLNLLDSRILFSASLRYYERLKNSEFSYFENKNNERISNLQIFFIFPLRWKQLVELFDFVRRTQSREQDSKPFPEKMRSLRSVGVILSYSNMRSFEVIFLPFLRSNPLHNEFSKFAFDFSHAAGMTESHEYLAIGSPYVGFIFWYIFE